MLKFSILSIVCGIFLVLLGYVATLKSPQKPCLYVQANSLNVREKPSMNAKIISALPKNTAICEYSKIENGFLKSANGYIATQYLNLTIANEAHKVSSADSILAAKDSKVGIVRDNMRPKDSKPKIALTSTQKAIESDIKQARSALELKDYTLAKSISLRINKQNPKDLESWEIFAKSLYLEGNSQEAILVLQNFLRQNYDATLTQLLNRMQQGLSI